MVKVKIQHECISLSAFYYKHDYCMQYINVREYRRGNNKWTIQRNWHHKVHKTKTSKAKTQNNMCWTSLYAKQTQITSIRHGTINNWRKRRTAHHFYICLIKECEDLN
jgi:hypothetical protein